MMPLSRWWRGAGLAISLLMAGCTSFQDLGPPAAGGVHLVPGDEVEVITDDGRNYRFTVTAVDGEAISGEGVRVLLADITTLRRKEVSA